MNIVDLLLLAILALGFISGMQKGFLTSLLATVGFVAAWIIAITLNMELSEQFMTSQFKTWLNANAGFDELLAGMGNVGDSLCSAVGSSLDGITATLKEGGVPDAVVSVFRTNIAGFGDMTVNDYLARTIWQSAFNIVSFAIVFSVGYAVMLLIVNLFNNVFRMPKLRGVDMLLGGVFGIVRGYAVVCMIFAVIPMLFTALDSNVITSLFEGSSLGEFFMNSDSAFADLFKIGDRIRDVMAEMPKAA